MTLVIHAVLLLLYNRPSLPEGVPLIDVGWWWWHGWGPVAATTIVAFMIGGLSGSSPREETDSVEVAD